MKKILYSILQISGGHISAARAIIAAMEEIKTCPLEHKLIDFTAKIKTFWTTISNSYQIMNEYFPWSWKALFYSTNDPKRCNRIYNIFYPMLYAKKTLKIFEEEKPDLVVSLVGPATQGIVRAIKDMGKSIPVITIVLDPVTFHASWADPRVDRIVVATEEARDRSIKFGMPEEKIKVIGFPIHPRFLQDYGAKEDLKRGFDLDPHIFTALIMGGGVGI